MPGSAAAAASNAAEAVRSTAAALADAGCDTPRLDAELLVAAALGVGREELAMRPEQEIGPDAARHLAGYVGRRSRREPVAYILGRRAFRDLELELDGRVLVPRPETETLVEVALEELPEGGRVHDVGTGSGAVALALAHERPDLRVSASDVSPGAIDVARANAERLGLDMELSIGRGLPSGPYDLVVANLPYVREDEWPGLAPEIVGWEPRDALVAGPDGLDEIRAFVAAAPVGTRVALEHAPAQADAVRNLLREARTVPDLGGRPRVTLGAVP